MSRFLAGLAEADEICLPLLPKNITEAAQEAWKDAGGRGSTGSFVQVSGEQSHGVICVLFQSISAYEGLYYVVLASDII